MAEQTPSPLIRPAEHLTFAEKRVLHYLREAHNRFQALPDKHPAEDREWVDAIHRMQNLIAFRVARRADPDEWWEPRASSTPIGLPPDHSLLAECKRMLDILDPQDGVVQEWAELREARKAMAAAFHLEVMFSSY